MDLGKIIQLGGGGFVDAVVKCAIQKEKLYVFGNGKTIRDYIYIDDVCAMLEKVIQYNGGDDVFNIGTGIGTSQEEIISYIQDMAPDLEVAYLPPRTVDVPCNILDNSRITRLYKNYIDVKQGIKLYYDYMNGK